MSAQSGTAAQALNQTLQPYTHHHDLHIPLQKQEYELLPRQYEAGQKRPGGQNCKRQGFRSREFRACPPSRF